MKGLKMFGRGRMFVILTVMLMMSSFFGQTALAQEYPTQPVTVMIGFAVGGAVDVLTRIIGQEAGKTLGQEFVPVNKAGGGGAVGAAVLASSKPDGYTLAAEVNSTYTMTPHLESVPYKYNDMIPIVQFSALNTVMVVKSDSPFKSMNDLIDAARKNPGKISYGHAGIGTTPYMAMEQIILEKKVNIATVPFGGSTPAITALLGGHIQVAGVGTPNILKHVQAGTMRVLVANTPRRIPQLPDVPTLAEAGMPAGLPLEMYVLVAPKGTPVPVIKKLEGAFLKAMETPAFKTAAENFGVYAPKPLSGEALKKEIDAAYLRNGELIKKIRPAK